MVAPKRAALGFFAGVRALLGGVGFVVGSPRIWPWACVPVLVAAILFAGAGALAVWGGTELSRHVLDPGSGEALSVAFGWALRLVLWLVGIVLAFLVALSLAQPISGFALEAIARRQEKALGGRTWPDQPFVASALRGLRVSLTALALSLPLLAILTVVAFFFPPAAIVTVPLQLIVTGLVAAYDFLDYPLGLRGAGVTARFDFIRRNFWAVLGFGVTAAALLLIPGFALVLLPFGVAGATRMVVDADAQT
jgi:CysZ protein